MEFKVYVGGEDYTKNATFTVNEQDTIDLSLATGNLTLKGLSVENPFKPFTDVIITIENKRTLAYVISNDNVERVIAQNIYNHNISLIEQSKILERYQIVNRSVKNPTIHNFSGIASTQKAMLSYAKKNAFFVWMNQPDRQLSINQFIAIGQTINIPSILDIAGVEEVAVGEDMYLRVFENGIKVLETTNYNERLTYTTTKVGAITIEWFMDTFLVAFAYGIKGTTTLTIYSNSQQQRDNSTITDAVNKLLQVAETLRVSETPRYHFNEEQATRYSSVICPEMNFNGSLWECLKQIGDVIHSVPRLRYDEIYFDEFGLEDKLEEDISTKCISDTQTFSVNNFASALDSVVQNIVNTDNEESGAIQEPFSNGYITPRAENGEVIVTDTNCFIPTKYPIEKIIKVEVGTADNGGAVDITPFVYEQTEYNNLTSYGNSVNSKAYAIYYKQGQKNIYGMNFKQPYQTSVEQLLEHPFAIKNILKFKTSGSSYDNIDIRDFTFRITYIPQTTIRARQYKVDVEDIQSNTIAYNQSANKISSIAYGEAMKGAIAKLGNPERTLVFILNDVDLINKIKCGIKYDDEYYISVVKIEWYKDFAKVSIGLSKGFNAISEYVGIKNELRHYEVTTETQNAYTVYEDFIIIGYSVTPTSQAICSPMVHPLFSYELNSSSSTTQNDYNLTKLRVTTFKDNSTIGEFNLPLQKYSIGNSIVYSFEFADNYSAGKIKQNVSSTQIQQDSQYGDLFGEVDSIKIEFGAGGVGTSHHWYDLDVGNSLPYSDQIFYPRVTTGNNNIVIDKGNAENICFSYQMHFVRNDKKIIIGKPFIENCFFLKYRETTIRPKLYASFNKISEYQEKVNLEECIFVSNVNLSALNHIEIQEVRYDQEWIADIKSWVIADDEGDIFIAKNTPFRKVDEEYIINNDDMPYISAVHKI